METSTQQLKAMQSLSAAEENVDIVRQKVTKNKAGKSVEQKTVTGQICGKCGYKHEPLKCSLLVKFAENATKETTLLRNANLRKCMKCMPMTVTQTFF